MKRYKAYGNKSYRRQKRLKSKKSRIMPGSTFKGSDVKLTDEFGNVISVKRRGNARSQYGTVVSVETSKTHVPVAQTDDKINIEKARKKGLRVHVAGNCRVKKGAAARPRSYAPVPDISTVPPRKPKRK